jgi:polyhydroxybutyrate depolymerase
MSTIAALALGVLAACHVHGDESLQVGTTKRHYELFVPSDQPGLPLVIALHGHGGTGKQMERSSKFDRVAAREQFLVAYPDGIDRGWNDGRPEVAGGPDDVAFIAGLIDELAARYSIDRTRVYVTGASNGGMMTYRIGCDLADRVAAIAPVIGNVPAAITCMPSAPVSLLAINGTDDPLVPYNGGQVAKKRGEVLSATLSTQLFARADGCGAALPTVTEPDEDPGDGSRTHVTRFACPAPAEVELITLDGAGHTWPGGAQYLPAFLIGGVSRDFDGAERIWDFFAAHSRR